jgi:hypothetical protein
MAQITVLADMRIAPTAGLNTIPHGRKSACGEWDGKHIIGFQ